MTSPREDALTQAGQARFEQGLREHGAGRAALAEASFRAVLAEAPGHARALGNLAEVVRAQGRLAEALALFSQAVEAADANGASGASAALLRSNFGAALVEAGRLDEAAAVLAEALALDPAQERARVNLANARLAAGALDEARALLEETLRAQPDSFSALATLGAVLVRLGQNERALPHLLRALQLEPRAQEARATLAGCLVSLGFVEEGLACHRAAQRALPGRFALWSPLLFAMHYDHHISPEALAQEAARFGTALESSLADQAIHLHANDRSSARRLRVGYLSPDLRRHPVGFFLAPILEAHDRAALELFAYSDTRAPDELTARLRGMVDSFQDSARLDDAQLAAQIVRDRIDVLVDLAGHTTGNRLAVFARRPAPVQVSWLGYPDTTGLRAIGWRITDAIADPPGAGDALHTERLLRLPRCFLAWQPRTAPAPLLARARDEFTFGSFNNVAKLNPRVAALWSKLLLAVPRSRLLLKSRGLALAESREHLFSLFTRAGLARERITLLPFAARAEEALLDYQEIDLALDPFPYNGTTTTCEALSMGAPLVALRGQAHAGRVGASILESVAAEFPAARAWIAESEEDYLRTAVALAQDRARLQALRPELAQAFARAPVGDVKRLARELEAAFRFAWRAHLDGAGS